MSVVNFNVELTASKSKSKPSEKFTRRPKWHKALETFIVANDKEAFLRYLKNGADVNLRVGNYSVAELACKTPRSAELIKLCIAFGARINEINPFNGQFLVHLAAESNDVENLSVLLSVQNLKIENQNGNNQTVLCMLFETITDDNYNSVWNCIQLLLEYQANINTKNSQQKTPIQLVVENRSLKNEYKKTILQFCLLNYYCNVDENTKRSIQDKYFGVKIPEYTSQHELFDQLRDILNSETFDKFIEICQEKNQDVANLEPEMIRRLLQITIYQGKLMEAKTLLELVEGKVDHYLELLKGLMKKCCILGDAEILNLLLDVVPENEVLFLNKDPLLSTLVLQMGYKMEMFNNRFYECMEILLEDDRVEIDKRDGKNCTALHRAAVYKNDRAQRLLLAKGAYVGGEDLLQNRTITMLNLDVFKKHLNSCVAQSFDALEVNVMNFVPPEFKSSFKEHAYRHSNDVSFHQPLLVLSDLIQAKTVKYAQIIHHPVISCWLQLHWLNLREVLWFNATINFIHFISLSVCALQTTWTRFFCTVSSASLLVIGLIELILILRNLKSRWFLGYLPDNVKKMMFLTSTIFLTNTDTFIGAYAPLIAGINSIFSLDGITKFRISRHMIFLQEVLKNMLMCMLPCVLVLVSFAISFHTRLKDKFNTREETSEIDIPAISENKTISCSGYPILVTQIITMATNIVAGEVHINENLNYGILECVYLLFLICVIILLFNILTSSLRSGNSRFNDLIKLKSARQQIQLLTHYENAFTRENIMDRVKRIIIKMDEQNKIYMSFHPKRFERLDEESQIFIKGEQIENGVRYGRKMDDRIVRALLNTTLYNKSMVESNKNVR